MKTAFLAAATFLIAGTASAATTGFSLQISGSNNNLPLLTLTNTGDTGDISALELTIGNTAYNFDAAYDAMQSVGSFTFSLDSSLDDNFNGGLRSDNVKYTFGGFGAGEVFTFNVDIDRDNSNTTEDYRSRFLPGGSAVVSFDNGIVDGFAFDLTPTADNNSSPYIYSGSSTDVAPVPLPAGLPLLLAGLGAFGLVRRARRHTV